MDKDRIFDRLSKDLLVEKLEQIEEGKNEIEKALYLRGIDVFDLPFKDWSKRILQTRGKDLAV